MIKGISYWSKSNVSEHKVIEMDNMNCHLILFDITDYNENEIKVEDNQYILDY